MYEVFGIFDSVEEINACAAGLLAEGDLDNLRLLAKENGIPEAMVEGYVEGTLGNLTDIENAAIGRLQVEMECEKNLAGPATEIVGYLSMKCYEKPLLATGIRKKDKTLKKCTDKIVSEARKRKESGSNVVAISDIEVFKMAEAYYLED